MDMAATACYMNPILRETKHELRIRAKSEGMKLRSSSCLKMRSLSSSSSSSSVQSDATTEKKNPNTKPSICTADELHYVAAASGDWRLALWRYNPPPKAPRRNHPLLLLSGVGTNAIGFDLSPGSSFARHMSSQGYDTWILEVRGSGLSTRAENSNQVDPSSSNSAITKMTESSARGLINGAISVEQKSIVNKSALQGAKASAVKGNTTGLLEATQKSLIADQIKYLIQRLVNIIEGQRFFAPQLFDLQERLTTTIEDFQKQLDLILKYDWDFDNYLEEDVPSAVEYIRSQNKPKDGKLLAVGHSMGGILLYAMLSRCGFEGRESGLAAVVTLASSLDYTSSNSSLRLLLPLADPIQAFSVPALPLEALLAAVYPLSSRPPYVLSWLNPQISAHGMMHPELFEKLVLNNFCTVPTKLLLQLSTVFQEGGLCDRSGTFLYKDHLHKNNVPVLALAGDQDLICPPEAVYETVKVISRDSVRYKIFGERGGPHYAHYDLVGGHTAADQVHPYIIEFLNGHDQT